MQKTTLFCCRLEMAPQSTDTSTPFIDLPSANRAITGPSCIQHCFICRPSGSTLSQDAGIEPRVVVTLSLEVRRSNLLDRSHPQLGQISYTSANSHQRQARSHPHSARSHNSARSHPLGYLLHTQLNIIRGVSLGLIYNSARSQLSSTTLLYHGYIPSMNRPDLIHTRVDVNHTQLNIIHTRLDLSSSRSNPHSTTSHPSHYIQIIRWISEHKF